MSELKKIKGGKSTSMDGIIVQMLKNGGINVNDWMLRMFNIYMDTGVVPEDWKVACIIPIHKVY